jgi:hypothetical protein
MFKAIKTGIFTSQLCPGCRGEDSESGCEEEEGKREEGKQ